MHKGHLTLIIFLLLELHSLIYLEILSYYFCFLFRIINLHSQTGSSKEVCVCGGGCVGERGGGGESLQIYTNSIIHLKDREACADSIDPNQMSQSVPSDLFATIQQFF